MAEIFFGLGASHGPLLSLPPESWEVRANFDRNNPEMAFRDGTFDFPALLEERKDDRAFFESQIKLDVRTERFERCQKQLDALGDRIEEADPDIIVIVGDDQKEWFFEDIQPPFAVYCGEGMTNLAYDEEERADMIEGGRESMLYAYRPHGDQTYPVATELAQRIIDQAIEDEFDVTASMAQPRNVGGKLRSAGHAYGYIYRRIIRDRPIPIVPILNNTFYPPNQPTPKRCFDFGRSIGRAIRSWESDLRVAVIASGGVSHSHATLPSSCIFVEDRPVMTEHRNTTHLVGSIPLNSSAEVFETVCREIGGVIKRPPDGETGARTKWISFQRQMLVDHEAMEPDTSIPKFAFTQWDGKVIREVELLKLKDGVDTDSLIFPIGYAEHAIASYADFQRLQSSGVIPADVLFQVSLPTAFATGYNYVSPNGREKFLEVFERSIGVDVGKILDAIPHDRLSIQWDVCQEVLIFENYFPNRSATYKRDVYDQLAR
ncbi:MAG: hypothetical protein O3A84_11725, partial [Proteobacteria bacterium]|nr:hypothetical protein [Pseudomonadota bacterium]